MTNRIDFCAEDFDLTGDELIQPTSEPTGLISFNIPINGNVEGLLKAMSLMDFQRQEIRKALEIAADCDTGVLDDVFSELRADILRSDLSYLTVSEMELLLEDMIDGNELSSFFIDEHGESVDVFVWLAHTDPDADPDFVLEAIPCDVDLGRISILEEIQMSAPLYKMDDFRIFLNGLIDDGHIHDYDINLDGNEVYVQEAAYTPFQSVKITLKA
jgi:hypothetical protein